ncbi:unnamed protein product [Urochloa decumbens]|uniref:non-specific serine/threonine protein kinase n=1 Tax=Urochloa decumbens TaxID=240449 RepID=A0ABC8YDG2_9POAL
MCVCVMRQAVQCRRVMAAKFCFLLMVAAAAAVVVVEAGDDATVEFAYDGFGGAALSLDGMAAVTPAGLLLLTNDTNMASSQRNDTAMSKGHAFHPEPVRFHGPAMSSFSTTFVFAIVSEFLDLSTSGFAFLVSPTTDLSTAMPQQYLGMFNGTDNGDPNNRVFAVEFDTVRNPEFADINNNHVGVDVNSLNSSAAAPAGYYDDGDGAFWNLSLISREPMQVWVDYDAGTTEITVAMAPARRSRPKRPLLQTKLNLSAVIADTAYVGFSSASSIVLVKHYVLGWSFRLGGGDAPALDYAKLPKLPRIGPKPRSKALTVALPIATTAAVLAAVAAAFVLLRRRRRYAELREDWEVEFGPHRFAYKDLYDATGGFKDKRLLGAGGFGRVYKGVLPGSRTEIAVKKVSHESRQGMKEFVAEVVSIGRLRHRNLVQLLGYCRRKGELLLVYDYMPNGSLDKHLHYHDKPVLDWARRLHIIRGVAAGLLYMHEDWEKVVIHRDIKASNVLLDAEMNGRLGDFGLARLYDHGADPHTTHVVGTMGYLAPELVRTGRATTLSDVFAFGAFVLEVACGRRPVEEEEEEDTGGAAATAGGRFVLVDWVLGHWREGSIAAAVDARLGSEYDAAEADMVLRLGLACLHPSPAARPSMRQVTQYLDGSAPLPEELPATMHATFSAFEGVGKYQPLFESWYVCGRSASTATMSVAAMSDIALSGGR